MAGGVELASAYIQLIPSLRGAQREIQRQLDPIGHNQGQRFGNNFSDDFERQAGGRAQKAGKKIGSGFGKAFAAAGGLLAAAGIGSFLSDSIGEARDAQKVGAATESILKATGGAAKLSAKQIGDLSSALSDKTAVDDEQIQAGANLLLTFKNVKKEGEGLNDVFGRATAAGLDLAAAGFGSVEGNAKQLGKALNDPLKGIAALAKSGVTFTEGQKEQIKGFVKANDLLSAQKIILGEVEAQVGGTAAATATSGERAQVAFGNLKEEIGTALLPVLDRALTALVDAIPTIKRLASAIKTKLVGAFALVTEKLEPLRPIFEKITDLIRENPQFVKAFAVALGVLVGAIGAVTIATTAFSIALNTTGIPLLIIGIAALVAGLVVAYKRSDKFREIVDQVGMVALQVGNYLKTVVLPAVTALATTVATKLKPIFDQLAQTFVTRVLPVLIKVFAKVRESLPALGQIALFVGRWTGTLIRLAATILGRVLPPLIRLAGFIISKVVPAIATVITKVIQVAGKMAAFGTAVLGALTNFREFATGVGESIDRIVTNVTEGIGGIPDKIIGFVGDMTTAGAEFIGGLFQGMKDAATGIGGLVGDIASAVGSAIVGAINGLIQQLNDALPNKIKLKGAPDINLPNNPFPTIPGYASGTNFAAGGLSLVGEKGPELVTLPRGSRVDTAAATSRMARQVAPLAGGFGSGMTAVLSVGGQEFPAWVEFLAEGVVQTAQSMSDERSRAAWSTSPR